MIILFYFFLGVHGQIVDYNTIMGFSKSNILAFRGHAPNLLIQGDFSAPSADVEGDAYVGGNVNAQSYSIGAVTPGRSRGRLVVGGSLDFQGQIYGDIVFTSSPPTGTCSAKALDPTFPCNIQDHNKPYKVLVDVNAFDFEGAFAYYRTLSTALAQLDDTMQFVDSWGTWNFASNRYRIDDRGNVVLRNPGVDNLRSLDVISRPCGNTHTVILFGVENSDTIVFNWKGNSCGLRPGGIFFYPGTTTTQDLNFESVTSTQRQSQKVINNYPETLQLYMVGGFYGSQLCPFADISTQQGVV
jgi:choice-of-anchor A domain-containing protein